MPVSASSKPAPSKPAPSKPAPSKSAKPISPVSPAGELSRAAIVEKALQIADADTLEAVTIRRLAGEFDVTPMALYWHVKNKDELLAAMGDAFYDAIPVDRLVADTSPWNVRLGNVLDELIAALQRHPASVPLAVPRIMSNQSGLRLTELALSLLRGAGFSPQQSSDIARAALHTAIMLIGTVPGEEFSVAEDEREQVAAAKRAAVANLPQAEFPRVRECIDALTECEDVQSYLRSGRELFLAGVEALHARLS